VFFKAKRDPEVSFVSSLVPTSIRKPMCQIKLVYFIINKKTTQKDGITYPYGLLRGMSGSQ
jgi:hypothetical protein